MVVINYELKITNYGEGAFVLSRYFTVDKSTKFVKYRPIVPE